jgi:Na+/melibiose symporter-like transporter
MTRLKVPLFRHAGSGGDPLAVPARNPHEAPLRDVLFRPASVEQANQRNTLIDAIGVGLTAGVASFLSVFLVRLGATTFQVGLLTSMPALTGMLLSMPIGAFLARRTHIVPWFARSRFAVLLCYALTGLVPFLVPAVRQPQAIIAIWALATLPQTVVSVAFTVVMGSVAGPGGRLTLMSRRWTILGLTNAITVLVVGQLLKLFQFPLNYQVVFLGSAVGALISVIFSSSIKLPPAPAPAQGQTFGGTLRDAGPTLRRNRRFVNFTAGQFVYRIGLALAVPLFPIYWVRVVGATDQAVSLINSTQTFAMMASYFLWTRVSQRRGQRLVLLATTFGLSFYPLLTALTHNPGPLVLWAGLAGLFAGGVDLIFFDILLGVCPSDQQASYVGMYQTTVFAAAFIGPLIGTAVSNHWGIAAALVFATVLRLAGFALMAILRVRQ